MSESLLTLWFLGTPYKYAIETYIDGVWRPDWYVRMYSVPLREMLGKKPVEWAEELLQMATSGPWARQYKRTTRLGDRFTASGENWIFISSKDIPRIERDDLEALRLTAWPDIAILRVERTI